MRRRIAIALCLSAVFAAALIGVARAAAPSAAELDKLMAPVALYPDQLLGPMLVAAGNPGKVGTLSEWMRSQRATGSDLQAAASSAGFDDSYVALVLFPDVVNWMAGQADWTRKAGAAFAADRSAVFASIQRLRKKAKDAGTLKTTPQQSVETKQASSGEPVIVIEPSNPQVVYVPQYNPQVVYTQPASSTVVVHEDNSGEAVAAGLIGFTAGIAIGAAFDNDYYYGPYGWHGGYMYNDGWDDYWDHREDAREDWQDHREDMYDNRSDRAENARENRSGQGQSTKQQRTDRQQTRQENRPSTQSATATRGTNQEARGYSGDARASGNRTGTKSDAFSNYSSGRSERAASSRGKSSRGSRSGGSRRR
jgi:hypothetical protein